ncbi:MAG: N-acetylmuramoyl-L-alanine amidase [Lachnospiraceae bacterium]|nr:N-acetylmuramoyl-L-alanine amidase [Lachnospiraceae bacterium]
MRHTNFDIKRILISSGIFAGVLIIMCLTAGLIKKAYGNAGVAEATNISDGNTTTDPGSPDKANDGNRDGTIDNAGQTGDAGNTDNGNTDNGNTQSANAGDNGSKGNEGSGSEPGNTDNAQNTGDNGRNGSGDAGQNGSDSNSQNGSDGNDQNGSGDNPDNTRDDSKTYIICIDAAHQSKADTTTEPIGPGASSKKYKCTSGATGVSGALEYELNLNIAIKLRDELTGRGYGVIMIRESNDVNISDGGRAQLANETSNMVIHIHCNAEERENISGVMVFEPDKDNSFVDASIGEKCRKLGTAIVDKLAEATGAKKWGVIGNNNLTALNWTTIPAAHVEVGYLTNAEEEKLLKNDDYQKKIVTGIADGIDLFFAN